ncbi:PH domain-containing protein [Xanthobacter dioxanivorans]|uniref:PH domain-containing protein n=1 Tax=Xanthobacter dioxanivorans TaxID=2528964 RepID=A0A974SJ65_9HYPH|nr:PH domain-containing protein [Xanthobacter dioxanivorans]QRG07465.1 PH domain-containing protein [Xanthobacter dioxanivorans]
MRIDMERRLAGRLLRGERVLWAGRPKQGLLFAPIDFAPVLVSLVAAAVLGFALYTWLVAGGPAPVGRRGGPVVFAVGWAALYGGRHVLDAHIRRHTTYAVTDRRIIILQDAFLGGVTILVRARLNVIDLQQWPSGQTISFAREDVDLRQNPGALVPSLDPVPRFLCIADADQVFGLIHRTQPEPIPILPAAPSA